MSEPVRLQKVLAAAGIASRRGADELIAAGRVTVDGRVAELGERVIEDSAAIAVDGRRVVAQATNATYLACHKPPGVTSTVRDRHADRTVIDLVPARLRPPSGRLVPVGRLDRDSEGLILLTSDGEWANRVMHPRYGVEREYAVGVRWPLDQDQQRALRSGVSLDEGVARVVRLHPQTSVEAEAIQGVVGPGEGRDLTWYRVDSPHRLEAPDPSDVRGDRRSRRPSRARSRRGRRAGHARFGRVQAPQRDRGPGHGNDRPDKTARQTTGSPPVLESIRWPSAGRTRS